jgi:hypothetical protein
MHHIDRAMWNHNSLSPGDVDGDGFTDYAVIHEGPDVVSLLFHPGKDGDVRAPWKKVIIGRCPNTEYAWLSDFDGDGRLDAAVAGGLSKKASTGIKVIWGPSADRVQDGDAWIDGGFIPATRDRGHFLFVVSRDVNGDGAADIVAGGRVLGTHSLKNMEGKRTAGIVWIEAPSDRGARRDPARWTVHDIDPKTAGGHGFVFADIDGDGDDDIADCNADWNTREEDERVLWYENPGAGTPAQKQPWPAREIYRGSEFFSKAQLAPGDLDGDGLLDLCVQTKTSVFWFRQTARKPVAWTRIVIPKPEITRFLARPTKLADLDGDGKTDIAGMLIHDKGRLPAGKASVFWMTCRGDAPRADNWITRPIKWSDDTETGKTFQGEKWDHLRFVDVDRDGDLDIIGNCEEHYGAKRQTIVGVVWFENPGKAGK